MELLWIPVFVATISIIGWIYGQIQDYIESERSKKRDEIAVSVIADYGIREDDISGTNQIFDSVVTEIPRYFEQAEEYQMTIPASSSRSNFQLCPTCGIGFLVSRRGKYGTFLGCSRYPSCKTTKQVSWKSNTAKAAIKKSKEAQKAQFAKEFMEDLERAYS
jgi:hypothetical protein